MDTNVIEVPLDRVLDHPLNSHVVTTRDRAKIANHIRRTKRYPPLVVRELTEGSEYYSGEPRYYQILDGHQRRLIFVDLVEEGHEQFSVIRCDDWSPLTDEEAALALATLNSWGSNAPRKRAELLYRITKATSLQDAGDLLPENQRQIQDAMKLLKQPVSDIKRILDQVHKPDTITIVFVVGHSRAALAKFTAAAQIFALAYGATVTNIHTEQGGDQGRTAVLTFDVRNSARDVIIEALKKAGTDLPPGTRNKRGESLQAMASHYLTMILEEETGVPLGEIEEALEAEEPKPKPAKKRARSKKKAMPAPAPAS